MLQRRRRCTGAHIDKALRNVSRAYSIATELDDLAAAVNHEKY